MNEISVDRYWHCKGYQRRGNNGIYGISLTKGFLLSFIDKFLLLRINAYPMAETAVFTAFFTEIFLK
jgi:hypothetical protein